MLSIAIIVCFQSFTLKMKKLSYSISSCILYVLKAIPSVLTQSLDHE